MPHHPKRVTHVVGSNGIGPGHFGHELEPWLGRRASVNMASDHIVRLLSRRWLFIDRLHHATAFKPTRAAAFSMRSAICPCSATAALKSRIRSAISSRGSTGCGSA